MEKRRIYSKEELNECIDKQVSVLERCGVPIRVLQQIENERERIVEKAFGMFFKNENMPILIVIPFDIWSYSMQMDALCQRLGREIERRDSGSFKERKWGKIYSIFDIEVGTGFLPKKRSFLSVEEMVSYLLQNPDCLRGGDEVVSAKDSILSLKLTKKGFLMIRRMAYEELQSRDIPTLMCKAI